MIFINVSQRHTDVVDLGMKKFAKVFVMPYGLQEKLCHLKSTCIQAKQLQYNNDIHYVLMIFIFSNQFSLICNVSRWFSFLNEVSIEE